MITHCTHDSTSRESDWWISIHIDEGKQALCSLIPPNPRSYPLQQHPITDLSDRSDSFIRKYLRYLDQMITHYTHDTTAKESDWWISIHIDETKQAP